MMSIGKVMLSSSYFQTDQEGQDLPVGRVIPPVPPLTFYLFHRMTFLGY